MIDQYAIANHGIEHLANELNLALAGKVTEAAKNYRPTFAVSPRRSLFQGPSVISEVSNNFNYYGLSTYFIEESSATSVGVHFEKEGWCLYIHRYEQQTELSFSTQFEETGLAGKEVLTSYWPLKLTNASYSNQLLYRLGILSAAPRNISRADYKNRQRPVIFEYDGVNTLRLFWKSSEVNKKRYETFMANLLGSSNFPLVPPPLGSRFADPLVNSSDTRLYYEYARQFLFLMAPLKPLITEWFALKGIQIHKELLSRAPTVNKDSTDWNRLFH